MNKALEKTELHNGKMVIILNYIKHGKIIKKLLDINTCALNTYGFILQYK